ncbi:MAG: hypothetical protein Q8L24_01820 [bacterium]|nr:hypothetical protein [bacterium]
MDNRMLVTKLFPDHSALYAAALARCVIEGLIKAFYNRFLRSGSGQRQWLGVMLAQGITADEDLDAGLQLKDVDALLAAIEAAKRHRFGLRFFVHPKEVV